MNTLADELPRQQARCREILEHALELPPASGRFLVAMLRAELGRAERAAASGDLGAMVLACKRLQEFEE
jgi:hypothetical protein